MFTNDYCAVACPKVLSDLQKYANEYYPGYGMDTHSQNAENKILSTFGLTKETASVFFLCGGTQTNMTVISYLLRPYEAVICCDTGHINVHETGAVEASGHKVLTCINQNGKILPEEIRRIAAHHTDEHMVKPGMVYLSDSTETGSIYTLEELKNIRKVCDDLHLLLFLDGARLGTALTSPENDVRPEDLADLCDVFYVGGTKNGAIFGEAIVMKKELGTEEFRYHIKNRGAMIAKGFATGIQFETLFTDNLYFEIAKHSNKMAEKIREGLQKISVPFAADSPTNQIFIHVASDSADVLMEKFGMELWSQNEEDTVLRIVTSFMTTEEECDQLLDFFNGTIYFAN